MPTAEFIGGPLCGELKEVQNYPEQLEFVTEKEIHLYTLGAGFVFKNHSKSHLLYRHSNIDSR